MTEYGFMINNYVNDLKEQKKERTRAPISAVYLNDKLLVESSSYEGTNAAIAKLVARGDISEEIRKICHNPPLIRFSDLNRAWDKFSLRDVHDNYYLEIQSFIYKGKNFYRSTVGGDGSKLSSKEYAFRKDKTIIRDEDYNYIISYEPNFSGRKMPYIFVSEDISAMKALTDTDLKNKNFFNIESILEDFSKRDIDINKKKEFKGNNLLVLMIGTGCLSQKTLTYNVELHWAGDSMYDSEIITDKSYVFK